MSSEPESDNAEDADPWAWQKDPAYLAGEYKRCLSNEAALLRMLLKSFDEMPREHMKIELQSMLIRIIRTI